MLLANWSDESHFITIVFDYNYVIYNILLQNKKIQKIKKGKNQFQFEFRNDKIVLMVIMSSLFLL